MSEQLFTLNDVCSDDEWLMNLCQTTEITLESLTIADCSNLVDQIHQSIDSGLATVLNLENCNEIDTAGIQLLVSIQADIKTNLRVRWTKPSEVVAMKAARLGVQSWINAGFLEN